MIDIIDVWKKIVGWMVLNQIQRWWIWSAFVKKSFTMMICFGYDVSWIFFLSIQSLHHRPTTVFEQTLNRPSQWILNGHNLTCLYHKNFRVILSIVQNLWKVKQCWCQILLDNMYGSTRSTKKKLKSYFPCNINVIIFIVAMTNKYNLLSILDYYPLLHGWKLLTAIVLTVLWRTGK